MKKGHRTLKVCLFLLCLFFLFSFFAAVLINQKVPSKRLPIIDGHPIQLQNRAAASLVADFNSGQIIAEKNPNEKLPIASTSKLLTAYLVYRAVQQKKLAWDQRISVNRQIQKLSRLPELMNVPLQSGQSYTVKELLDATLLVSSNATGILLGNAISGNQRNFADLMNRTAASFGIPTSQFNFYNAVGISNDYLEKDKITTAADDAENEASAKALVTIASRLFKDFPAAEVQMQASQLRFAYPNGASDFVSESVLTRFDRQFPRDKIFFSAIKSGSSPEAGSVLLALTKAMPNGHRYLVLTSHASDYLHPWPTWTLAVETVKQVSQSGHNLRIGQNQQIPGAEDLYLQKTSPNRIPLKNSSEADFWTAGPRREISAGSFAYDRQTTRVTKGSVFVTKINNLRNFDYLYGQKGTATLRLKAADSAFLQSNPFVRYWRWISH